MTPTVATSARATAPRETWERRSDTGWRVTLDGLVLLPAGRPEPVTVAGSAAAVWELLAEPATTDELVEALATAFDADRSTIRADLAALLPHLVELEAIRRARS